jgi:hypothetical protein
LFNGESRNRKTLTRFTIERFAFTFTLHKHCERIAIQTGISLHIGQDGPTFGAYGGILYISKGNRQKRASRLVNRIANLIAGHKHSFSEQAKHGCRQSVAAIPTNTSI